MNVVLGSSSSQAVQLHQVPVPQAVLRLLRQRRVLPQLQLQQLLQQPGPRGGQAEVHQAVSRQEPKCI